MKAGVYGFSDEIPENILTLASAKEKQKVVEWLRQVLSDGVSLMSNYHLQELGGFLLELQESELDDESYIQICRETGRQRDLIDRLLSLNRINEAIAAATSAADYELLQLANLFVLHNKTEYGEKLIASRIKISKNVDLTTWLKDRAEKRGDIVKALKYARIAFWKRPSTSFYTEMRQLAHKLDQWETIREECLKRLWEEKKYSVLVEIYLLEGDIDLALEMLKLHKNTHRWEGPSLALKVAQEADKSHPYESIRLYAEVADQLISRRGRGNYTAAVDYLLTIRRIYKQIDDEKSWEIYITELREKNKRLPAMKDEFDKAGL
jgi:uncharacterized Zn finger protein